MIVNFIGATRRCGTAKASGKPYDMCMFFYATPVESVDRPSMQYSGYGHETKEMELNPQCLYQFDGIELGQSIDIVVEPKPNNPRFTWVVGIKDSASFVSEPTTDAKKLDTKDKF